MARRWLLTLIVTAVFVLAAIVAARAIRDDPASTTADRGALTTGTSSTTSAATTTSGTPATSASAPAPVPTTNATTATTGPPGPCGSDTAAIRASIDAGVANAAANADIATCRLAASDPTWASVQLTAKPGAPFNATTVIVHRVAGAWVIVATGGANAGCGHAPQQVIVDLGQFCAGTGGGGA